MPDWLLASLVTGFLTFVVTLLVIVVKNRRKLVTYHDTHDRIGISAHDEIHGKVSVTVGSGAEKQNLYMSNIWLVNRSMSDIENLAVKVYVGNDDMELLSEQTHIEGTVDRLEYAADFTDIKNQIIRAAAKEEKAVNRGDYETGLLINKAHEGNLRIWSTQRWYDIPVLARGQTINFTYMTNIKSNLEPKLFISCQKAGVRVKYKLPYQPVWHLWGVPLVEAGLSGVVIGTLVWFIIINSFKNLWLAALLSFITGLFCNMLGAVMIKVYRWIRDRLIG